MTGTMAMHIFVPAMPAAAGGPGASPSLIQSTITLYIIGLAAGQLIYGPLSDRFGRRPVLLVSLALYVLGLVLAIPVASVGALIGARVLQSLGACGALVLGRAMVRDSSTGEDAVRRLAAVMIAMIMTPAIAPAIGGAISGWLGWRAVFRIHRLHPARDRPHAARAPRVALDYHQLRSVARRALVSVLPTRRDILHHQHLRPPDGFPVHLCERIAPYDR